MLISHERFLALAAVAALQFPALIAAQALKEQVWAVFAYTLHGDSIPNALPRPRALTPFGASELYAAGSAFRDRYVAIHSNGSGVGTRISNLSPYALEAEEVSVLSRTDQPAVASAQAFFQGLYPPLGQVYDGEFYDPTFVLANGSLSRAPLNGYQYPQVITVGLADPRSIIVDGQFECTLHEVADLEYKFSPEVQELTQESETFYSRLYNQSLRGVYDLSSANYANAFFISEFLEYELLHNKTLLSHLKREDIERARWYADRYMYATNGNVSSSKLSVSNDIRTIAGRTLASHVLEAFDTNIQYRGANSKMNLVLVARNPLWLLLRSCSSRRRARRTSTLVQTSERPSSSNCLASKLEQLRHTRTSPSSTCDFSCVTEQAPPPNSGPTHFLGMVQVMMRSHTPSSARRWKSLLLVPLSSGASNADRRLCSVPERWARLRRHRPPATG